jgi:hypothetical protein
MSLSVQLSRKKATKTERGLKAVVLAFETFCRFASRARFGGWDRRKRKFN